MEIMDNYLVDLQILQKFVGLSTEAHIRDKRSFSLQNIDP